MNEEKLMVAAPPLPFPAPDLNVLVPPKRKKGRPPKNRDLLPPGENTTAPPPPKADGRGRRPKRKNGDVAWPAVDSAFIGQQVHGVLDGSFDAGYLLTVRVGNTQTVLRGAVFEPTLSVPISQVNDIAPHVKFISRTEQVAPLLPSCEEHLANPALSSPVVAPPITSGNTENAPTEIAPAESTPLEPAECAPAEHAPTESSLPSENTLSEPGSTPTAVITEYQKDAAPLAKDYGAEERAASHSEHQSQTEIAGQGHVP